MTDAEVKQKYIVFRSDPRSMQYNDLVFCSKFSIPIDRLRKIVEENPDVMEEVNGREVTNSELTTLLNLLTRISMERAFTEKLPIKSLEGILTAIVSLLKQRATDQGKPTEIIELREEEIMKKPPKERYEMLMSYLRRPSN